MNKEYLDLEKTNKNENINLRKEKKRKLSELISSEKKEINILEHKIFKELLKNPIKNRRHISSFLKKHNHLINDFKYGFKIFSFLFLAIITLITLPFIDFSNNMPVNQVDSGSAKQALDSFRATTNEMLKIFKLLFSLFGLGLSLIGIFCIKKHMENPYETDLKKAILMLIVGSFLMLINFI